MKYLLTLTLIFMMGILLCPGRLLAEEPGDGGDQMPELYDSSGQQASGFLIAAVGLTDDGDCEETPGEELSE